MKTAPHIAQHVATLAAELPVEDIWYFEASHAVECESGKALSPGPHLVSEGEEAYKIEALRRQPPWRGLPRCLRACLSAEQHFTNLPRPLVLKMAMTAGKCVYQK